MFTVDGKTDKEATLILRNLWIFSNAKAIEAWDWQHMAENKERQLQLVQAEQEECLHALHEEEAEQAKLDEWKKYKNKFAPIPECPLQATALLLPLQHTLNKLQKGDYVPLYSFTNKGLCEAEEDSSVDEDLLTLVQTDKGPSFQTAAAARAKKNRVKDEHLSWEEFSQANYRMLNGWRNMWLWSETFGSHWRLTLGDMTPVTPGRRPCSSTRVRSTGTGTKHWGCWMLHTLRSPWYSFSSSCSYH